MSTSESLTTDYAAMTSEQTVIRTLTTLIGRGNVCEIRCIGVEGRKQIDGGYFTDFTAAAKAIIPYLTNGTESVYIVLNQIKPELLARAANRIKRHLDTTASDNDVTERRWLFIDIDPVRSAKISSTAEQVKTAVERAADIAEWLMQQGFCEPISAMSGNGAHLLFPICLPNDDVSKDLIKRIIGALNQLFGDAEMDIDETVFNAARICKLYGTFARKGDDTEDRPHRRATLLHVPDYLSTGWNPSEVCDLNALQRVAAMFIDANPKTIFDGSARHSGSTSTFDLPEYLDNAGLTFRKKQGSKGWTKYLLSECPFDASHKSPDSYVSQHESGAVTFFLQSQVVFRQPLGSLQIAIR